MKKKLITFGMVVATAVALTGCSAATSDDTASDTITIGISMSTLENPFFSTVKDGAVAYADDEGIKTLVADAQNDTQKQLNDVQDLITKGAQYIILNPVEPESA